MLLEEAARLLWRFSLSDPEKFKARAKQYFDEYRFRRRKAINALIGGGVSQADAQRIFALPGNVRIETPLDEISRGRTPLPTISSMLKEMGAAFDEPGWLDAAYSLLSQITHSTPIGHLHVVRVHEGSLEWKYTEPGDACAGARHGVPGERPPHRYLDAPLDGHEQRGVPLPGAPPACSRRCA